MEGKQGHKLIVGANKPYLLSTNVGYTRPCYLNNKAVTTCKNCGILCTMDV